MRSKEEYINKVIEKMEYTSYLEIGVSQEGYFNTVRINKDVVDAGERVESIYDIIFINISDDIEYMTDCVELALLHLSTNGMIVLNDTAITTTASYELATNCNGITWDKFNGVTLIPYASELLNKEDNINIQSLGAINTFLNEYTKISKVEVNEEGDLVERISLKDYYRLCLPDNKIGRKSDATLIKELEDAGFKVG